MEEQGPFDSVPQPEPPHKRDRAAIVIVGITIILGLVLLVLVLPPISIFDDGVQPGTAGSFTAVAREELPAPPPGFGAVSPIYDLTTSGEGNGRVPLTVRLSTTVAEGASLTFFTYQDGDWGRVGDAVAVGDGTAARGEVSELPANVAVFRPRQRTGLQVIGSLPAGTQPDSRALASLTQLNPGGLVPAPDGSVAGVVQLPANLQLPVVPTISASTSQEAAAINTILASSGVRGAHVQAILGLVRDGGYAGIDLDYRAMEPVREDDFVAFVDELSSGLRAEDRTLSLTLPLPLRSGETWDTLGFDWEALAPLVSSIKLPLVPDQDQYYQHMEEVLAFLVPSVGTSEKLLLTVSPLSRERSVDGVQTLTLNEALALASAPTLQDDDAVVAEATVRAAGLNLAEELGGSGLHWDDTARSVSFSYTGPGGARTVWIANVFSEAFRLDLARRYQLGGVAVEDISERAATADIWPVIQEFGETGSVTLVKPNGKLLQPRWQASAGSLESDVGSRVSWRLPAEAGSHTLTLIVSDGVVRMGQQLLVAVQPRQGVVSP